MPSFPRVARPVAALLTVAAAGLAPTAAAEAAPTARGSVGQAYVVGAKKGQTLKLLRGGKGLATGKADKYGSFIFRGLKAGKGYRVRIGRRTTTTFNVLGTTSSNPPQSFFRKIKLKEGLNYVKVRDGIELAMTVRLPPGKTLKDGPFPTVIEHSGYQTAAPNSLLTSIATGKSDPLAPAQSTVIGSAVGPLLGFASVSVQMRGSGCSGGAFDLFDLPTTFDGYDMVETVGNQSWVKGGRVGLFGISFSGITQLFTAGTRPPHLAAIAPMSVTDDTYTATGYPGGIFNDGFALSWIKERMADAAPAPAGGQPWAKALTKAGDKHCIANQKLRLQTEDALEIIEENPHFDPAIHGQRAGATWLKNVDVPTFLVGQFQDEQTGGHFAQSLGALSGNKKVWLSLQNGVHVDSLSPSVFTRWVEFLQIYVGNEVPRIPDSVLALSGQLFSALADAGAAKVEQSRFAGQTDVAAVRAQFERDPRVRLLMDNGTGAPGPGSIGAGWDIGVGSWPVREAVATSFFLGPNGALDPAAPAQPSTVAYTPDPKARPAQTLPGNGEADAWAATPPYRWLAIPGGKGLGWTSTPLTADAIMAGSSSLDLTLRSTAKDTDLQVTLSEVRPDGAETYVQSGWLRASHRKLDAKRSTAIDPVPTHLAKDAAPLPAGKDTVVRVPLFPAAHAFRAGSRIRVTVEAPGGDRPRWHFQTIEKGRTQNTITLGGATPSKLVLPVLPGVTANGTPLPAPTALRGQPSRTYVPAGNGG